MTNTVDFKKSGGVKTKVKLRLNFDVRIWNWQNVEKMRKKNKFDLNILLCFALRRIAMISVFFA